MTPAISYALASGQLSSLSTSVGEVSSWNYDHAHTGQYRTGRVIRQKTQTSANAQIATVFGYGGSNLPGDPSTSPSYLSSITQSVNSQPFWTYSLQHSYLKQLLQQTGVGSQSGQTNSAVLNYDQRGRLVSDTNSFQTDAQHTASGGGSYNYDLSNNLQGGSGGWTYNSSNQATSAPSYGGMAGGSGLSYDASGNLVAMNGASLGFDARNLLSSISTTPFGAVSYSYDGTGRRVSKTVGSTTTFYLYAGHTLIAELDSGGNITRSYTWGPLGLISDSSASGSRFYLFDGVGDTRALLDSSGAVLNRAAYSAWGTALTGFAPNTPFGWKGQRGQYTDSETGFVYCRARYYSPALGRFLSRDASGFSAGPNLYSYCAGDPINFFDASGFGPESNEAARDEGLGWDYLRFMSRLEPYLHYINQPFMPYTPGVASTLINAHDSFWNWGHLEGTMKANPNDLFWARVNAGVSFAGAAATLAGPVLAGVGALGEVTAEAGAVGTAVEEGTSLAETGTVVRNPSPSVGFGNVDGGWITEEQALRYGEEWVGPGYRELHPGVFRSADNLRQFRMTAGDLTDLRQGPHVHFESIGRNGRMIIENSHAKLLK